MDQNRRRFLRKVPDDIAFIQIERDEVGKVLNISEGGLSFSSITPVPRNLPVYFWFSFNLKDRIEAMGEVTWTDISRTIGGLKFTQLSQTNREVIQKWVSRLRREESPEEIEAVEEEISEPEEESLVPQLVAVGPPEPFRTKRLAVPSKSNGLDRVARFVSKARAYKPATFGGKIAERPKLAPPTPLGAAASALGPAVLGTNALAIEPPKLLPERPMFSMEAGPAASMSAVPSVEAKSSSFDSKASSFSSSFSFRGIESLIELVPLQRHLSAKKRQLVCGVLLGIGISALVTLPALKFWNSRAHAETLKPALTDSSALGNTAVTQPPASDPATVTTPKPAYPVAGVFSEPSSPVPLPTKGKTSSFVSRTQLPSSYWKEIRGEPAKTTPVNAQKPSTKASVSSSASTTTGKKSGMNTTQLWGAVQAGNSNAAVELAERYLKGDGVPKNCQQARVLLLMASEKRNTAAIKRLNDLDKGAACP